ncbi:phosphatases II [Hypoxylon sp. NC1633]|nr:phosphatases II [Hypoxylon sp. NC1633]
MDHLSSRFRRTKKNSTVSPAAALLSGSPPDKTVSDAKLNSASQREAPPSLTIPTDNSLPKDTAVKSPFRRGFHFRRSHKRARSPAPVSPPLSATPTLETIDQDRGAESNKPASMLARIKSKGNRIRGGPAPKTLVEVKPKPTIPEFLTLSRQDIEAKFHDLNWLERFRIQDAIQNPSPSFKFARVTSPEAKLLDRYANIQPWANNRIKLQVPEGQLDYINASPIVLQSPINPEAKPPHRYIAMQGPKSGTIGHVWRMVAEQLTNPVVIIMLTETHEGGIEKCYQYFPQTVDEEPWQIGEDDEFGDGFLAHLRCVSVEIHADNAIEVRKLSIHVVGRDDDITVWHLMYRKWPDFGVPALEDIGSFFELMRLSREKNASEENPRIIHCSAGVGRSGTFMALEHLMREIDSGDLDYYEGVESDENGEEFDIIYKTVDALREQRKQMVQADAQYLFIYQVLRKRWLERHGLSEEDILERPAKRLEVGQDPFS